MKLYLVTDYKSVFLLATQEDCDRIHSDAISLYQREFDLCPPGEWESTYVSLALAAQHGTPFLPKALWPHELTVEQARDCYYALRSQSSSSVCDFEFDIY